LLFNTNYYIFIFLPVVFLGYFLLQRLNQATAGKFWLVLASLYFYAYWNPSYLLLILVSIGVNFAVGRVLHQTRLKTITQPGRHRALLALGIAFNLAALGYFKYTDFFVANVNVMLGTNFPLLHLVLPLAISFFTFQQIAYLVDCYQKDTQEYNFLNYCLFVSFFPQLIAGPIVHHGEMMPQFSDGKNRHLNWQNIACGVLIFGIGLFKKVVIADSFAIWANQGYAEPLALTQVEAWATSLSYTFQLYFDFSGYTDMAIGAALLFNIRLPLNFNSPYKALSIQDFWRRWHMTLSRWLRDYVYVPLGGNRVPTHRIYLNLFLTFVIGGLWHGAGWTFLLWGVLHGLALCLNRLWRSLGMQLPIYFAWAVTFLFVHSAWVVFRAPDIPTALAVFRSMLGFGQGKTEPVAVPGTSGMIENWGQVASDGNLYFIAVFAMVAFFARNSMELIADRSSFRLRHSLLVASSLLAFLLLGISSEAPEFLYFNF
jgi:alginate O-acetyltransferase complex protein AlgI